MSFRFFISGLLWLGIIILLFSTPTGKHAQYFYWGIPSRSIIYGLMFMGLVHMGVVGCMKQLKYAKLRKHAFLIVFSAAIIIGLVAEVAMVYFGKQQYFRIWNIVFEVLGSTVGIVSFKLMYRNCY